MIDIPEPLRASASRLQAARQASDADAIAGLCSEDALLITPSGQRLAGRAAIATYYRETAQKTPDAARKIAGSIAPQYKFYFYPPLAHAVATLNGRHGEKHSFVDIYQQQADQHYLLVFSSWTLR